MTSVRESDVIAAAREVARVVQEQGKQIVSLGTWQRQIVECLIPLADAVGVLDTPISYDEVLTSYRQERATLHAFMSNPQGDQDALLLAWDEARTRYMAMLVDYAMGIGITVGKAERGLAAYLAAEVGAS